MADGGELVVSFLRERSPVSERLLAGRTDTGSCRQVLDELEDLDPRAHLELMHQLLDSLAVWLPIDVYERLPVMLPHVLRDNGCRKQTCTQGHSKRSKGRIGESRDLWSTPSPDGYVRDDNSLIKNIVAGSKIDASNSRLKEATISRNYVACHLWPMASASDPWLNSFVPNLVWLPKPLDVYSDRDGHIVQQLLRARARAVFEGTKSVANSICSRLWQRLPAATGSGSSQGRFNSFAIKPTWMSRRANKIRALHAVLGARIHGEQHPASGHSHYDLHVHELQPDRIAPLADRLADYLAEIATPPRG